MPIVIPPLIAWTLGALGAVALTRTLMREWRRVNAELDRASAAGGLDRDELPTLRRDPASGVYRVE
jgi:hypothetical protein